MSVDVPKYVIITKCYQTEIILHWACTKQYRSFGLSNITRKMRISTTDYTSPIATVEITPNYIASRWPRYIEFSHLINNKSTRLASDKNVNDDSN